MAAFQSVPLTSISPGHSFRNPTALTRWLESLLAASIIMALVSLFSNIAQDNLLSLFGGDGSSSQLTAQVEENDQRQRIIGIIRFVIIISTILVFCCWIHRANRNARSFGAVGMTFTPPWSVGWYFIPIASLWKPFQAMREIWKASVDPVHWQSIPTNPLLGWWWAGFLVSNILDQASFRMSTAAHGLRALHDATVVAMISDTTDIIAIVLAGALVERLYRIQIARAPTI